MLPFLGAEKAVPRKPGWLGSASVIALTFAASQIVQQIAYRWTSVTNASFPVNLCTVLTPLLAWVFWKARQPGRVILAAFITLAGASLMTGVDPLAGGINPGDLACLALALSYAGWMIALGRHAKRHGRSFATCLFQFVMTAVFTSGSVAATQSPTLWGVRQALPELIMLGIFSTAVAFALQTHAQHHLTPSTAAVRASAESLIGAATLRKPCVRGEIVELGSSGPHLLPEI